MFVRPRVLSILTTRRCTAACDHCCVGASPHATSAIPVPRIHRLIDEARRVPSIERIVFTGGECTLLGRDLDALVRHAHDDGFATRVMTNGYWAVNERAARERAVGLRQNGLDGMILSTGTFHQRFVPVTRVIDAARAAAGAGIATRISIEDCDQTPGDDTAIHDELADLIAARRVHVSYDPWIPDAGGRGATELTHHRVLAEDGEIARGACAQILTVISVTPDQQLVSCCGYPMEELPALRIASVAERALDDVLSDAPDDLIKMWLHVAGPSGIAAFVAQKIPGYTFPAYASICHACTAIQRDARAMAVVAAHASQIAQTIHDEFVRVHSVRVPLSAS